MRAGLVEVGAFFFVSFGRVPLSPSLRFRFGIPGPVPKLVVR